jgi:CHAT domain-containing protein/tetratricopeptide (TPR) repeat protein
MHRLAEAEPLYRQAIDELEEHNDLDSVAHIEGKLGFEYLKADRPAEAEPVLENALYLIHVHRLSPSANVLAGLAQLRDRQGDVRSAERLFDAALHAPPNLSPVWTIPLWRGQFRMKRGDLEGALSDFRAARRAASEMRADMVPADQDRVALETGLNSVVEELVEAGNRLAVSGSAGPDEIRETFDAAEQDRLWSLRALVPGQNDWRSRLPAHYWELLARRQALERSVVSTRSANLTSQIGSIDRELQEMETAAGDSRDPARPREPALEHVQKTLCGDCVLFSFLIAKSGAWVWAVDSSRADVFPLPAADRIAAEAEEFRKKLDPSAGRALYSDLFGGIAARYTGHARWLIEPDGPLNYVPFAALSSPGTGYLAERAAVETVPGALLLERSGIPAGAAFAGIGDAVYNSADPRYRRDARKPDLTLPRLPNTKGELDACARAWGMAGPRFLTGLDAESSGVEKLLRTPGAIVHFATHVITEPGDFRSGLIALSLDRTGAMELLGPKEIVAHPVSASLIVMNGCHSAQGETLPGSGLMGLTRSWIGAGAKAVIATAWDVPDATAETIMTGFYGALRAAPERGPSIALQRSFIDAIHQGKAVRDWAAYSLVSRVP